MSGEAIIIVRPGTTTDRYGNTVDDWDNPTSTTVVGDCKVAPSTGSPGASSSSSEEHSGGRQAVANVLTVYAPPDTDIQATDRVQIRGDIYEVDGEPGSWVSPASGPKGVVFAARRVVG